MDLFRVLGPAERERVAHEMVARRFGHGERIIEQGAPGQTFYVVAAGSVSILTGRGVEVTRLGRGQYFGEMSLLTGEPRSATVVAAEDAVLFELDRPTFAQLFDEQPALAGLLSEALAHRRGQLRAVAEANGNVVRGPGGELDPRPAPLDLRPAGLIQLRARAHRPREGR